MKIALVSPYDFAYPGGVAAHIGQLARQFVLAGHQVKIMAPSSKPPSTLGLDNFVHLGIPVPVPSGGSMARISLSFWLMPKIRALLEREQFDVVHLHEPLTPVLPLCVLEASHSLNVGTFHAYHGRSKLYPFTKHPLKHWFSRLHGRIAVSEPARQFISRYFPADYRVIPNGIDADHFSRPVPPLPQFADGKVNLLFVGRLERRKGLRYLLGAYSRLRWEFPNLRLIVVGPGTPDKDSYRIMGERGLTDVVFVGGVPYPELPRYYQAAHIFCATATGKESFGIVLLEAMAAGTPIVASNIEGYAAVLKEGGPALLARPRDEESLAEAIRHYLLNPELRERMGSLGPDYARRFRWERVAAQVLDLYDELLQGARAPRVPVAAAT